MVKEYYKLPEEDKLPLDKSSKSPLRKFKRRKSDINEDSKSQNSYISKKKEQPEENVDLERLFDFKSGDINIKHILKTKAGRTFATNVVVAGLLQFEEVF